LDVPSCPGFESIDADIDALGERATGRYDDFVDSLVPQFFPDYSMPRSAEDYCSAPHLALIWLANDDLQALYSQKEIETRFLLAFLFVEWKGTDWRFNNTGWLDETSVCIWAGVSCDASGDIAELDLPDQFYGVNEIYNIPDEIGFLTDLRTYMLIVLSCCRYAEDSLLCLLPGSLKLYNNQMSGTVPLSLGNLTNLGMYAASLNEHCDIRTSDVRSSVRSIRNIEFEQKSESLWTVFL
jgi:hypothetical protein